MTGLFKSTCAVTEILNYMWTINREKTMISRCPEKFMALHVQELTPHGKLLQINQYLQYKIKSQISNIHEELFEQYINILYVYMSAAKEQNSLKKNTHVTAHKNQKKI